MATLPPQANLGAAELRLVILLEDLERTVQTAERLANDGLDEEALEVIERQRAALIHLPDQVARDLTSPPARRTRRLAAAVAAAAFTALASVAAATGLLGRDPTTPAEVRAGIALLDVTPSFETRLAVLERTMDVFRRLDHADPSRAALGSALTDLARRTEEDISRDPHADPSLAGRAQELVLDAQRHTPAAPGQSASPLDPIVPEL